MQLNRALLSTLENFPVAREHVSQTVRPMQSPLPPGRLPQTFRPKAVPKVRPKATYNTELGNHWPDLLDDSKTRAYLAYVRERMRAGERHPAPGGGSSYHSRRIAVETSAHASQELHTKESEGDATTRASAGQDAPQSFSDGEGCEDNPPLPSLVDAETWKASPGPVGKAPDARDSTPTIHQRTVIIPAPRPDPSSPRHLSKLSAGFPLEHYLPQIEGGRAARGATESLLNSTTADGPGYVQKVVWRDAQSWEALHTGEFPDDIVVQVDGMEDQLISSLKPSSAGASLADVGSGASAARRLKSEQAPRRLFMRYSSETSQWVASSGAPSESLTGTRGTRSTPASVGGTGTRSRRRRLETPATLAESNPAETEKLDVQDQILGKAPSPPLGPTARGELSDAGADVDALRPTVGSGGTKASDSLETSITEESPGGQAPPDGHPGVLPNGFPRKSPLEPLLESPPRPGISDHEKPFAATEHAKYTSARIHSTSPSPPPRLESPATSFSPTRLTASILGPSLGVSLRPKEGAEADTRDPQELEEMFAGALRKDLSRELSRVERALQARLRVVLERRKQDLENVRTTILAQQNEILDQIASLQGKLAKETQIATTGRRNLGEKLEICMSKAMLFSTLPTIDEGLIQDLQTDYSQISKEIGIWISAGYEQCASLTCEGSAGDTSRYVMFPCGDSVCKTCFLKTRPDTLCPICKHKVTSIVKAKGRGGEHYPFNDQKELLPTSALSVACTRIRTLIGCLRDFAALLLQTFSEHTPESYSPEPPTAPPGAQGSPPRGASRGVSRGASRSPSRNQATKNSGCVKTEGAAGGGVRTPAPAQPP